MNQHFFSIKSIVKQLFVAGLIAFVSLPVFANKYNQRAEVNDAQPMLQVAQSNESAINLNVQFSADTPIKYDIVIRDVAGDLIYRKTYETSKVTRQFKLVEEPETNNSNLSVAIELADGKIFNYIISNTVALVKDTRVNGL